MIARADGRRLFARIDALLSAQWDPLCGAPRDEYIGYVGAIVRLVIDNASVEAIAARLELVRTRALALRADRAADLSVAASIAALRSDR